MAIERKSIDYIAEDERHGRVIDQVPFWFLGNFHFFTIAIGFVGPSMGLSFGFTSLAGALGILFGTLFVAFHASQGAELGMPQMIQSRAQFGYRGVVVVLFGTLFTFIGFNVADSVLMARGLNGILGWNETAGHADCGGRRNRRSRSTATTGCTGFSVSASGCACRSTPC